MSKKSSHKKIQDTVLDPVYSNPIVAKLINKILMKGKKSLAQKIVYGALTKAATKAGVTEMELLEQVLRNTKPTVESRSRRVGGVTYQVPLPIQENRQICLVLRWFVNIARQRSEHTMVEKLSNELLDAFNKTGRVMRKRIETHKMAESNKAFAQFKW